MDSCLLTGAAAQDRFDEILRELGWRLMLAMLHDAGRSRIVEAKIALRLSETGEVVETLQRQGTAALKDRLLNSAIGDSPAAQFGIPELEGITWWESPRDWDILVTVEDAPVGYATDVVATAEKAVAYDSPVSGYGTDPR